jgi:hypothetical protein
MNQIALKTNSDMTAVTQNVVDLFESIQSHYVVNHSKSVMGGGFGFMFGHHPICEHSIKTGYKTPTAVLRLTKITPEFIASVTGKSCREILNEVKAVRVKDGDRQANLYGDVFQDAVNAFFNSDAVKMEIFFDDFIFLVDISHLSETVINAVSTLLQHSSLHVRATCSRTYRV